MARARAPMNLEIRRMLVALSVFVGVCAVGGVILWLQGDGRYALGVYMRSPRESGGKSLEIGSVTSNQPAGRAGIQVSDRIVSINGEELDDYEELQDAMRDIDRPGNVRVGIERTVTVALGSAVEASAPYGAGARAFEGGMTQEDAQALRNEFQGLTREVRALREELQQMRAEFRTYHEERQRMRDDVRDAYRQRSERPQKARQQMSPEERGKLRRDIEDANKSLKR